MKIAVTLSSNDPQGMVEERFGRCAAFWIYDQAGKTGEVISNEAANRSNGAGVDAAKNVIASGAEAVITGRLGPNATQALQAAGIPAYIGTGMTVEAALEAFAAGKLAPISEIAPGHK